MLPCTHSPAGPIEDLRERLAEDMMASGTTALALDVNLINPYAQGVVPPPTPSTYTPSGGCVGAVREAELLVCGPSGLLNYRTAV